jgi:hypothetical protein
VVGFIRRERALMEKRERKEFSFDPIDHDDDDDDARPPFATAETDAQRRDLGDSR